jgi:pSer/pThr/pTyr-binding forkhead associated (FHA) protein
VDDPARKLPSSVPASGQRARPPVRYALRYRSREIPLSRDETIIGRSSGCDIVLDSTLVSRRHARIVTSGDLITVEDLGSRNGVVVNDRAIRSRTVITAGDTLSIGDEVFELLESQESPVRNRITINNLRAAPTLTMPALPDTADEDGATEHTRQATAFELLGGLFDKSLALGRGEEAERMLSMHLQRLLDQASNRLDVPSSSSEAAVGFAVRLAAATGKPSWVEYTFRLYHALGRPLPLSIIDELYAVLRRTPGVDLGVLRSYISALREQAAQLTPAERFALQRLEGLERLVALL